jgi:hypothetical protein
MLSLMDELDDDSFLGVPNKRHSNLWYWYWSGAIGARQFQCRHWWY